MARSLESLGAKWKNRREASLVAEKMEDGVATGASVAHTRLSRLAARVPSLRQLLGKPRLLQGLLLTALLAAVARMLSELPGLGVIGPLVLAILLGMAYRELMGGVPLGAAAGITFSSRQLLRLGIILLGMRLNLMDIIKAGPQVLLLDAIHIAVTIPFVYWVSKRLGADRNLGMLTACGTAICGAAAVAALSPQLKARQEETAVAAAVVAILGTIFTITYTLLYPVLKLGAVGYGAWAGSTLHEVAHVLAAAAPMGREALDMAVLVKLARVAMLVPVALLLGVWVQRSARNSAAEHTASPAKAGTRSGKEPIPVPWFIFGFLAMSGVNTLGIIPPSVADAMVVAAYLLIAMAMAGLGLGVDFRVFRRLGGKAFLAGLAGSVLLAVLGFFLVQAFGLAG
ncbi:YeiH family protein [Paenibacillus herberti]|nr:YeiH family protein [Paenibacillus herberti]